MNNTKPMIRFLVVVLFWTFLIKLVRSTTPHTIKVDGIPSGWSVDEMSVGTSEARWYITWDHDSLYIGLLGVVNNREDMQLNDTTFALYIDTDPNPYNPKGGNGSIYGVSYFYQYNILPFAADYQYHWNKLYAGLMKYEVKAWIPHYNDNSTAALNTTNNSEGFLEIAIPWSNLGNPSQIFLTGFLVNERITRGITPIMNNVDAFSANVHSYWAFLIIDGVSPASELLVNSYSTTPVVNTTEDSENWWSQLTWTGVRPNGKSVVYIDQNQTIILDQDITVNSLILLEGSALRSDGHSITIGPGGLLELKGNSSCFGNNTIIHLKEMSIFKTHSSSVYNFGNIFLYNNTFLFSSLDIAHNLTLLGNSTYLLDEATINWGPNSTLIYSINSPITRGLEWNTFSDNQPGSVSVTSGTTLRLQSITRDGLQNDKLDDQNKLTIKNNLIIDEGATISMESMVQPLVIGGDIVNNGTISLSGLTGGTIQLGGKYYYSDGSMIHRNGQEFGCPKFQFAISNETCTLKDGIINTTVIKGIVPFSIRWKPNGEDHPTLTRLEKGIYQLTYSETFGDGCPNTIQPAVRVGGSPCSTELIPDDDNASDQKKGFTAIAATVITSFTACILLGVAVAFLLIRKKKKKKKQELESVSSMETFPPRSVKVVPVEMQSIRGIGIAYDQNANHRKTMEDEHVVIDQFGGERRQGFFAIYDGHGGKRVVVYVTKNLHKNILKELRNCYEIDPAQNDHNTIQKAITQAFMTTDENIKEKPIPKSGSTAVTAIVRSKTIEGVETRKLYVANVGDSRAVLSRSGKAVRLSFDHKATEGTEVQRIKDDGGFVLGGKVAGRLAVTRSFGDLELKQWVPALPYITETELEEGDKYLILACDGLWDVCSDQQAVDLLLANPEATPQQLSEKLLEFALTNDTRDNVSVMVLEL